MPRTHGYLGIDAGTQGVTVIFADEALRVLAHGAGSYDMVPGLGPECFEQRPDDWVAALRGAMTALREQLAAAGVDPEFRAVGVSGQMHGEVLVDGAGAALGPARIWCDGRNEAEGHELTDLFRVKVPKRLTVARWLWTIRNRPELAARVARITTPAGWLAHLLTGSWTLGIGDASGMFPIAAGAADYDARLLADFDALVARDPSAPRVPPLRELLPVVRVAGGDGGALDARGAALLGVTVGTPVAPAEGDQPTALAGSLIGAPGMVAVSFGTSVCANAVGDRPFEGVDRGIDHFRAPDGRPINMVFLRNGTTALNAVVEMFGSVNGADRGAAFAATMPLVLAAPDDCGGLAALPFMDDEPGLGVSRGGSACLVGLSAAGATPGSAAKAMLLATMFNLRIGSDPLDAQGFPRSEIVLTGGLTQTPALGQLLADVFATPVTIPAGAVEGTALGAALLAKYRDATLHGRAPAWPEFLAVHDPGKATRFQPRPASVAVLARGCARHRALVALHAQLAAAVS